MYKIHFPIKLNNKKKLISFLKKNWAKTHILVKKKNLFNFLYKSENKINFITLTKKDKIISCLGLLFNNNKNQKKKNIFSIRNQVIWLTMWCTKEKYKGTKGLELINYILKNIKNNCVIATIGCNEIAYKIYKILGFKCGKLDHFYFLNKKKKIFKILNSKILKTSKTKKVKKKFLYELELKKNYFKVDHLKKYEKIFKKDFEYFKYKYFNNKFYEYKFLFVIINKKFFGFFVVRKENIFNSRCLRIIEYFGDQNKLCRLSDDLQNICDENDLEYIDFYNSGIKKKNIIKSGFKLKLVSNNIIIPNYFNPFIRKNIELKYAYYPTDEKMILFKGDCDQDRPN